MAILCFVVTFPIAIGLKGNEHIAKWVYAENRDSYSEVDYRITRAWERKVGKHRNETITSISGIINGAEVAADTCQLDIPESVLLQLKTGKLNSYDYRVLYSPKLNEHDLAYGSHHLVKLSSRHTTLPQIWLEMLMWHIWWIMSAAAFAGISIYQWWPRRGTG
ncbi:hypothetical protein [Aeoliella sp. SH292]|uniref:hypothetical protein n=1 Tax=Aeoliella sp. SH292 TaxID=3454464 RepID=UPI003F94B3F7